MSTSNVKPPPANERAKVLSTDQVIFGPEGNEDQGKVSQTSG